LLEYHKSSYALTLWETLELGYLFNFLQYHLSSHDKHIFSIFLCCFCQWQCCYRWWDQSLYVKCWGWVWLKLNLLGDICLFTLADNVTLS